MSNERTVDQYEEVIDGLQVQLSGVTEMLGQVLYSVGEEVQVLKKNMIDGLPGHQIVIDEHEDSFVLRITKDA